MVRDGCVRARFAGRGQSRRRAWCSAKWKTDWLKSILQFCTHLWRALGRSPTKGPVWIAPSRRVPEWRYLVCGICGYWGDPNGVNRLAMLQSVEHRGPDDVGSHEARSSSGVLWLGHRRLSIQDISAAGHQPMATAEGNLCVVFNGEIYNFHQVRTELMQKGYQFRSSSDTEVILHSWREWGPGSVDRFRGMFAFALWDGTNQELWLVRDRIGEKPLYFYQDVKRFLFASEVRALLASDVVPRRMDSDGLDSYLTFGSVADPYTLVHNVRAVEAGSILRVRNLEVTPRTYWTLADIQEGPCCQSREQLVCEVGSVLRESARLATVSDVPVAVLLSGGIDSSSNVVVLSEDSTSDLRTFSVVFQGLDKAQSEEQWSSLVANRFRTRHRVVAISLDQALQWVPAAVRCMDQPSWDGVNTYLVCKAISAEGIKVAISGQGADELFLGYAQRELFRLLLGIAEFPLRWLFPLIDLLGSLPAIRDTKHEKLLQLVGTKNGLGAAYLAQHSIFSQAGLERLRGSRRPPQTRFVRDFGGSSPLGKLSRLELTHYLRNTLLRDGDQMSMANSLEIRAPFVDHRLVELVSSIPAETRLQPPHRQKPLLVDAVGPQLPGEIARRPKQGFVLPYGRWLRSGLNVADVLSADFGLTHQAIMNVVSSFERGAHWSRFWCIQVLAAWAMRHRMEAPLDNGA